MKSSYSDEEAKVELNFAETIIVSTTKREVLCRCTNPLRLFHALQLFFLHAGLDPNPLRDDPFSWSSYLPVFEVSFAKSSQCSELHEAVVSIFPIILKGGFE